MSSLLPVDAAAAAATASTAVPEPTVVDARPASRIKSRSELQREIAELREQNSRLHHAVSVAREGEAEARAEIANLRSCLREAEKGIWGHPRPSSFSTQRWVAVKIASLQLELREAREATELDAEENRELMDEVKVLRTLLDAATRAMRQQRRKRSARRCASMSEILPVGGRGASRERKGFYCQAVQWCPQILPSNVPIGPTPKMAVADLLSYFPSLGW